MKKVRKREGGTFLEHLLAKRQLLPKLRSRRAEWLRAGSQNQSTWAQNLALSSPILCPRALLNHSEPVSSAVKYKLL